MKLLPAINVGGIILLVGLAVLGTVRYERAPVEPKVIGIVAVRQCDALRALVVENELGAYHGVENPTIAQLKDLATNGSIAKSKQLLVTLPCGPPDNNVTDGNGDAPAVPPNLQPKQHPSLLGQKQITTQL